MAGMFSDSDGPLLQWLFLDLNSYFASVEQEVEPQLRGRPVAVVPLMADTTCCIAASYEAKAFGVKTGTQVGEARRMCPGITFVEARHKLYVDYHNRIVEAVETCLPVSAVLSIDEMACRLMGRERPLKAAMALGRRVKQTIRDQVGSTLGCSVGLATNRYLAKVASDMEKPDGLVALTPDILDRALRSLELRALPGIGRRMEQRLVEQGIRTMNQFMDLSCEEMGQLWGSIQGERLYHWLRGEDFEEAALEHQKSIGHSHVLSPELRSRDGAWAVLHKLLHKSAMRLRTERLWATHLSLSISYSVQEERARSRHYSGIPQRRWSAGLSLVECQDNQTLIEGLQKLWVQQPNGSDYMKPFYVGVQLSELVPDHLHTLSLFQSLEEEQHRGRLTLAMDALNRKYGTNTLVTASTLLAGSAAPTRIAFTSIPDLF